MKSFNPETADRLRAKLNGLLTESQKQEIINKIKDIDKAELEQIISRSNITSFGENELIKIIENAEKTDILNKIKRL